jgi:hypothetical protein
VKYEPNIIMNDKTIIRMPSCGEETNRREGKNQIRLSRSNKQKTTRGIAHYPVHDYNAICLIVTLRFRPIYNYIVQTE